MTFYVRHSIKYLKFMNEQISIEEKQAIAKHVRAACVEAAQDGFERAAMAGLCHEGARELALDAIKTLDIEAVLDRLERSNESE